MRLSIREVSPSFRTSSNRHPVSWERREEGEGRGEREGERVCVLYCTDESGRNSIYCL